MTTPSSVTPSPAPAVSSYHDGRVVVWGGDCLALMAAMAPDSVDAIVTDPPYGLGFMGKKWDDLPPGKEWAEACYRVLKPGGHLLAFGGTRTWHRLAVAIEDGGFEIRDSLAWLYGSGFPAGSLNLVDESGSRTGWGTRLKPAFEPIVIGRRPVVGDLPSNVKTYGTGALNIAACRIETTDDLNGGAYAKVGKREESASLHGGSGMNVPGKTVGKDFEQPEGRWPANVVLDEDQERTLGSTVRYFYCAKAPKAEKPVVDGVAHPTVKPLTLMRWLVRLVTPPDGLVLDTFAGTGTTGEACVLEGFRCLLAEDPTKGEQDYLPLIDQRITRAVEKATAALPKTTEEKTA